LGKDPDEFYEVVKQFCLEAFRQGSTGTPLVQDRIKIQDFNKLKCVSMNFIFDSWWSLLR